MEQNFQEFLKSRTLPLDTNKKVDNKRAFEELVTDIYEFLFKII